MHNARVLESEPRHRAQRTLAQSAKAIGRALVQEAPAGRFSVTLRLYHGWHKGWQETENLRAMRTTITETSFPDLSYRPNVVFSADVQYGHTLLAALPERRHPRPPIHLPNTLRDQSRDSRPVEKMVDTALATDLLEWARSFAGEWALILSEDDDIVPPVFAAEAWIKPYGGRVLIVRTRRAHGAYLKLDGLVQEVS